MGKTNNKKHFFFFGFSLLLLLIGVTISLYFWQIRLQKPVKVNMGQHQHTANAVSSEGSHDHPNDGVSCEKIVDKETSAPIRKFELTAARTTVKLDNGKTVEAWTFNDMSPGPELRVQQGDRVVVTLHNKDIAEGVTIHWHGVKVPCSQDGIAGVTQESIMPGNQFTYTFTASEPGTYWYHSHQMSSIQVQKGLLGSFIVEPRTSSIPLSTATEISAIFQQLNSAMLLNGSASGLNLAGKAGDYERLRLINAGNDTINISVDGAPFQVIAMDGHDLHETGKLDGVTIPIGAGQRYDLLVQLPEHNKVVIRNDLDKSLSITFGSGTDPEPSGGREMFSFVNYGSPLPNDPLNKLTVDKQFELRLGRSLFVSSINNHSFHEIPPMNVKEGDRVLITITNEGGGDHPFHIHGHTFRVWSKNGVLLKGSPVYLDTLLTKKGETYEVYLVADNPGLWMAHCHNLQHASMGMSMMLNYEGITTPFRVGTNSGNLPDL
ncbi:multicopper oxidase family protein [Paenibacillus sp. WQ 127069]|uniref:Multicopper oxidase family protein n=1 Tax=Paenibacillus baimaensis TaxID=2982185 RepID=A0ABT2UJY5_9BACL|nr:multicopper oxidase family protein [Paenibacillus sp. WQ 127069]MCU6794955.1 multicopper oxidase family protein [Paenibacillus sp. WQ 127069]